MNIQSVLAFLAAIGIFLTAVLTSTDNPRAMIDPHGALIVIGGSLAATAISFQIDRVFLMVVVFWRRTIRGERPNYAKTIRSLMEISEAYRNSGDVDSLIKGARDPFLKEAMDVFFEQVVQGEKLIEILRRRVNTMYTIYDQEAHRFKSMGKFPPAMGLLGAVLGMIALLGGLGKEGAEANIGPAMSVALVATFYGISMANLLIIPIGENLSVAAKEMKIKNTIIVEGVKLISERTNPILIAEELNSFLLPHQRLDITKLKGGG